MNATAINNATITFTKKTTGIAKAKVLILGDYGVGKTHYALTFPEPLVIDTENALGFFRNRFDFMDAHTRSYDEINQLMDQAIAKRIPGETLVIDSITSIYKALQEAHPDDVFYKIITKKFTKLIDKLYGKIPMHVVMTAWEKPEYAAEGTIIPGRKNPIGEDERVVTGYTIEANRKALFAFDFVFRIVIDKNTKRRYAVVLKSRSDRWTVGDEIENPSFADFEGILTGDKFAPIMTNEEAAEIDVAAEEREAAAVRVVQAMAKEIKNDEATVHPFGSDSHIKQLIKRYNNLAPEIEKIKDITIGAWIRQQGIAYETSLSDDQRKTVVEKIEAMIVKVEKPKTENIEVAA